MRSASADLPERAPPSTNVKERSKMSQLPKIEK